MRLPLVGAPLSAGYCISAPLVFVAAPSGFTRLSSLRVDARSSHLSSLWAISYALYARPTLGACAFGAVALTHNPSTAGALPVSSASFMNLLAFCARSSLERPHISITNYLFIIFRLLFLYVGIILIFLYYYLQFILIAIFLLLHFALLLLCFYTLQLTFVP